MDTIPRIRWKDGSVRWLYWSFGTPVQRTPIGTNCQITGLTSFDQTDTRCWNRNEGWRNPRKTTARKNKSEWKQKNIGKQKVETKYKRAQNIIIKFEKGIGRDKSADYRKNHPISNR